ncbi:hypothetical protein [Nonlabens antarcticus]|uniref:hypothetical protein n=1 Tax=Nonlabens antarcticus TaxID=392714 RepID=UPI001890CD5C|nr:hypothetical protein [Nonlabens antarcticus]
MAARKRNPLIGGIFAMLMIGFGGYRFYLHYTGQTIMESWQMILSGAVVLYGLFVAYSVITQENDVENE